MRYSLLLSTILLAACGGGQESDASAAGADDEVAAVAESGQSNPGFAPCDMLTEAMVREYLQPGEIEINQEAGETRQSLYCQYQWYYEPTEEEQREMMEARMAWTTARHEARRKGEPDPAAPKFPSRDSSVFFNVLHPFDNEGVASSSFDTMVQRLTDGMTIETESLGDIQVQGGEMVLVEGLGDKAVWDPGDQQMSVLTGTRLFHLKVRLAGDVDSREQAERMAAELAGRF